MSLFRKKPKKDSQFRQIDEDTYVDKQTGELISTFIPARKARSVGRTILRIGRMRLFLLVAVLLVAILFIIAMMQEEQGNFVVNLDRLELFRRGISISSDADFTNPTAKLTANAIENAGCISIDDLPTDVSEVDGSHNGQNYMAYTFYIRNAGKEPIGYRAVITMDSASKGAEEAARVAVWKNNERTVYAFPAADGGSENGCVNFESGNIVCTYEADRFDVGNVDKYTVVIFLEGDDPECVDKIVGGALEFSMHIASASEDDTSLLDKFIEDIMDTINGSDAIGASGTEAPDTETGNVSWENRTNQ